MTAPRTQGIPKYVIVITVITVVFGALVAALMISKFVDDMRESTRVTTLFPGVSLLVVENDIAEIKVGSGTDFDLWHPVFNGGISHVCVIGEYLHVRQDVTQRTYAQGKEDLIEVCFDRRMNAVDWVASGDSLGPAYFLTPTFGRSINGPLLPKEFEAFLDKSGLQHGSSSAAYERVDKPGSTEVAMSTTRFKPDPQLTKRRNFARRDVMQSAERLGCYFCLSIFDPSLVQNLEQDGSSDDRRLECPECGIKAVIFLGPEMDKAFLRRMQRSHF